MQNDAFERIELKQRTRRGLGWKPDIPDRRDHMLGEVLPNLPQPPAGTSAFSLQPLEPEQCWDQGQLGSCTGHGVGFVHQFERKKQGLAAPTPSRLAVYYGGRLIEGDVDQDAGAQIRDVMTATATVGVGPESLWAYDISKFAAQPPQEYMDEAAKGQTIQYMRSLSDLASVKAAIYNQFPIVFGFTVYTSFQTEAVATSGMMPLPQSTEQVLGGHCVVIVGWDDSLVMPNTSTPGAFLIRNSWGTTWGINGHFNMPYDIVANPGWSQDFWTLRQIEA